MGVPLVLILVPFLWLAMAAIKYWYYSKFTIKYNHKLDDKILDAIRTPPPHIRDKIIKMQKEREKNFDDNPEQFYNSQRIKDIRQGKDPDNEDEATKYNPPRGNTTKKDKRFPNGRPMTIFEEMDMINERKRNKQKSSRYDPSMFEDPLSRLYKDLQNERKKAAEMKKANSSSTPEKEAEMNPPI